MGLAPAQGSLDNPIQLAEMRRPSCLVAQGRQTPDEDGGITLKRQHRMATNKASSTSYEITHCISFTAITIEGRRAGWRRLENRNDHLRQLRVESHTP